MKLGELVAGLPEAMVEVGAGTEVAGLAYDSRGVSAGDLFICIRGFVHDGHRFIPEAVARGAVAFLVDRPGLVPAGYGEVRVSDTRRAAPGVASRFFGDPSRELRLVGITGTNGKTTTAFLARQVLGRRGRVGLIGTVHNVIGDRVLPVTHTTPEAVDLQRLFRRMREAGDTHAVMEVSSHALSLHRADGCVFDVGVFTNLTRDHLDFHGDFTGYQAAKGRLFEMIGDGPSPAGRKGAVINGDDPSAGGIISRCRVPVLTYAVEGEGDLVAHDVRMGLDGSSFQVRYEERSTPVRLRLAGRFNVYNALAAFGVGVLEGMVAEEIASALEEVAGVPGRFELVPGDQPFAVVVDYAHTPDGLDNVLRAARQVARGRVIVAFGCGGDRDRAKRPAMGEIAARLADEVIVTTDNPRGEDPAAIAAEVVEGVRRVAGVRHRVVLDREEAVRAAVDDAEEGDVVIIAGKGHETYQIFRDRTVPFDDREAARRALAAKVGGV